MKKVAGLTLIGVALFSLFGEDLKNINWPDGKPRPAVVVEVSEPRPAVKLAVLELEDEFAAGGGESLIGLFAAVAKETEENKSIKTLAAVERFNYAAFDRYVGMAGFERVPGLGGQVDKFVFQGIDNLDDPRAPLTEALRGKLSERYLALEWLVQNLP